MTVEQATSMLDSPAAFVLPSLKGRVKFGLPENPSKLRRRRKWMGAQDEVGEVVGVEDEAGDA